MAANELCISACGSLPPWVTSLNEYMYPDLGIQLIYYLHNLAILRHAHDFQFRHYPPMFMIYASTMYMYHAFDKYVFKSAYPSFIAPISHLI